MQEYNEIFKTNIKTNNVRDFFLEAEKIIVAKMNIKEDENIENIINNFDTEEDATKNTYEEFGYAYQMPELMKHRSDGQSKQ